MKYMGSKNRIAKYILPIMLASRRSGACWVEPFVGGCNMIDKVDGHRLGNDSNEYLIAMWKALQDGWEPPDFISEDEWEDVKSKMESKYEKWHIAFTRIGCSFGADWRGGYARNVRKDSPNAEQLNMTTKSYCAQSKRNILKQLPKIEGVIFSAGNYSDMAIPEKSIIYCDPPYAGTTPYKDSFDHSVFWEWCRSKASEGHTVFISEYAAPKDFVCVWEHPTLNSLNNTRSSSIATEKLFIPDPLIC